MLKSKLQILSLITFSLISGLTAAANTKTNLVYKIAVKALSQKLQNDSAGSVNLKLDNFNQYNISKTETGIKGSGQANNLPISFDVKINTLKDVPTDVKYNYLETANSLAEPVAEASLTKNLLAKLKQDYKTTNIVIALDEVAIPKLQDGKNVYQGSGEVRIGFDWQKIDYVVTLNPENKKALNVKYDIQR